MIVLSKWSILFLVGCVGLQSCQSTLDRKVEKDKEKNKQAQTVSYNLQLGLGYLNQGDTPRAKRKLLYAMDLAPNSPEVNGAMAYFLEKTGDVDDAKRYYQKAMALAPNRGAELNNYGTFLCHQKKYAEAETYFLKAVQDAHYLHSAGAYENAGLCAAAIPDDKKARLYFAKALEQDPTRKIALYELATSELKQNNTKSALNYFQKYQELTLNDSTLLGVAINAAHKTGNPDLEANYKLRLSQLDRITEKSGENDEYSNSNG